MKAGRIFGRNEIGLNDSSVSYSKEIDRKIKSEGRYYNGIIRDSNNLRDIESSLGILLLGTRDGVVVEDSRVISFNELEKYFINKKYEKENSDHVILQGCYDYYNIFQRSHIDRDLLKEVRAGEYYDECNLPLGDVSEE